MRGVAIVSICAWSVVTGFGSSFAIADTLNVQVINVCDDNGQNCALSNQYAGYSYNPTAIQDIFNQAGVTVNLLTPVQLDSTAYLNPAVVDDPAPDT